MHKNLDFPGSEDFKMRLKNFQKDELVPLFEKADLFLKAYKLAYFMDAGTLLGAVRHKGMIPWDDDIDILLMQKDFDRLYELNRKNPDAGKKYGVKVVTYPFDRRWLGIEFPDAKNSVAQIDIYCLSRYKSSLIRYIKALHRKCYVYAGLFGLSPFPNLDPPLIKKISFRKIVTGFLRRFGYLRSKRDEKVLRFVPKMYFVLYVLQVILLPIFFLAGLFLRILMRLLAAPSGKYIDTYYKSRNAVVLRTLIKYEDLFPLTPLEFENKPYPAPLNYQKMLISQYGKDYKQMPPYESRVPHHNKVAP